MSKEKITCPICEHTNYMDEGALESIKAQARKEGWNAAIAKAVEIVNELEMKHVFEGDYEHIVEAIKKEEMK